MQAPPPQAPDDDDVEAIVLSLIGELGTGAKVTAPTLLTEAGLDSLACADLALSLEERFGVRLADGGVATLVSVADVVEAVRRKLPRGVRIPPGIGRLQVVTRRLAGPLFHWYSRLEVRGASNVPMNGPAILAANHRSMLDIPVLLLASPRPVYFMGKQELFVNPLSRQFFHQTGGFPVRREMADLRAVDVALAILERGDVVGIYPEGKRSKTGEMLPFLHGASWLALKTGAPVVPSALVGTEYGPHATTRGFRKAVRVSFGPAIQVEAETDPVKRRARSETLTAELLAAIGDLLHP